MRNETGFYPGEELIDIARVKAKLEELQSKLESCTPNEIALLKVMQELLYTINQDYGELILVDYFNEYIQNDLEHENIPNVIKAHIDWKGVARDCSTDYSSVTYDGYDYFYC